MLSVISLHKRAENEQAWGDEELEYDVEARKATVRRG